MTTKIDLKRLKQLQILFIVLWVLIVLLIGYDDLLVLLEVPCPVYDVISINGWPPFVGFIFLFLAVLLVVLGLGLFIVTLSFKQWRWFLLNLLCIAAFVGFFIVSFDLTFFHCVDFSFGWH